MVDVNAAITFIGSRVQLRINDGYVGSYDSIEALEDALRFYRGDQEV